MKRFSICLVFLLALSGCSNLDYLKKGVRPVSSDSYVIFEEKSTYTVKRGIGYTWKEGLEKGVYRPELENDFGTFFRGPPGCVIQFLEEKSMGPFDGGIWIPKDRINQKPMIYYYFNYNSAQATQAGGPVVSAILASSKGDITFVPLVEEKTFLNDAVVTNVPLK